MTIERAAAAFVTCLILVHPAHPARAAEATEPKGVSLLIEGRPPITLSHTELSEMPRRAVDGVDHGVRARFEGVSVSALLERIGAPLGEKLRGRAAALGVLVEAADGYRTLFALAELDPTFSDDAVILADRRDGQPLSDFEGPLRIVAVGDQRQARWVRQVVSLRLVKFADDTESAKPPAQ